MLGSNSRLSFHRTPIADAPFATFLILAAIVAGNFAVPVFASSGRDFAGVYAVSNATTLGDQVKLTFSARIFNYSDGDVTSATVTLRGPGAPKGAYATFYAITLRDRDSVRVSQEITVPAREYQLWRMGRAPSLVVQYQGLSGDAVSAVELRRGFVGAE
jgi:hypothetical protein